MTTCPHCHTANHPEATACQVCGQTLSATATDQDAALPAWLQQLKPGPDESTTVPSTNGFLAKPDLPLSGTSTVQSVTAAAPTKGTLPGAQPASQAETTSLISEDDLPVWLRAFGEPDTPKADNADADQSWMVGNDTDGGKVDGAGDLAQSWQVPTRPAAKQRSGAGSVFTKVSEGAPVATARPERAAMPSPSAPAGDDAARPAPAATTKRPAGRGGRPTTAIAIAAAIALILIVLVVFAVLAGGV